MKSYLCSALVLLAMVSCDSKKEAVKPSYKTPDMKLASDVMTPEVLWSFGRIGSVSVSPRSKNTRVRRDLLQQGRRSFIQ